MTKSNDELEEEELTRCTEEFYKKEAELTQTIQEKMLSFQASFLRMSTNLWFRINSSQTLLSSYQSW